MRRLILAFASIFAAGAARAQGDDANPAPLQSEWRTALDSSYGFEAPKSDSPSAAPPQSPVQSATDDPAIVRLAPVTVRDSRIDLDSLHSRILQSEAGARKAAIASKLGIGVHEIRGKHVTLGAVTIFYIPVAFGIKW
jgi:hypothetical protein